MVQRDGVGMDDCITIRMCCQRGVREQRKTEGQPNGPTLRQRDSERNSSGPSPELIGLTPENQTLLHNGSGIEERRTDSSSRKNHALHDNGSATVCGSGSQGSHTVNTAASLPNGTASAEAELIGAVPETQVGVHNGSTST